MRPGPNSVAAATSLALSNGPALLVTAAIVRPFTSTQVSFAIYIGCIIVYRLTDELLEWEEGLEGDDVTLDRHDLWLLNDRKILLVGVDQADAVDVGSVVLEREFDLLVLSLDVLGQNVQGAEDWEVDDVDVGARAFNDEHLVQRRECPWTGRAGKEW
jgi:hypothetical protein